MNTFLSGPQIFDATDQPVAGAIAGDTSLYQVYSPTTQPLTAATGGSANHATITIAPFQIQYPFDIDGDGNPDLISYNGGSITPLLDSTAYYVYFDDPTYKGGAQAYMASTQAPDVVSSLHRQLVGTIATPAFGGGGTSGTGRCFSGNTRIWTRRGVIRIEEVKAGRDIVMTRASWRKVAEVAVSDYSGPMLDMGQEELVKGEHRFWKNPEKRGVMGEWKFARELFEKIVSFSGKVYNLKLPPAKTDRAHSYLLANGWFVHNMKIFTQ